MTPQETGSDMPMSVQESLTEVCVADGLLQSQRHRVQQWVQGTFEGGLHYLHYLHHSLKVKVKSLSRV